MNNHSGMPLVFEYLNYACASVDFPFSHHLNSAIFHLSLLSSAPSTQTRSKLSTFVEIMMNLDWLVILGHKAIDVEMARKNKVTSGYSPAHSTVL